MSALFTAAQAAQKTQESLVRYMDEFTAAQAAQKFQDRKLRIRMGFTAAQAAQKSPRNTGPPA